MKNIISFGKFDKKFLYINLQFVLIIIILIVSIIILIKIFLTKNDFQHIFYIMKDTILLPFLYYFGQMLCIIPDYIVKRCFKNNKNNKNTEKRERSSDINLIYNNQVITLKFLDILKLIGICLISLMQFILFKIINRIKKDTKNIIHNKEEMELRNFLSNNQGFFSFLYIAFFFLCKFCFKQRYYIHQYISVFIITIIELIKFGFNALNVSDIKIFWIVLLLTVIFALFISVNIGYSKFLIDKKYFSIYKTCYTFGFINVPIILLTVLIYTFIPYECEDEENCYIFKIGTFFSELLSLNIIIYFIFSIFCGLLGILINNILSFYSPFNLTLPFSLSFFIIDIVMKIYNLNSTTDIILNILIFIIDIFEIILILVFLEVIELNFCGLSENTKNNIKLRSISETANLLNNEDDDNKSDDSNEEENNNIEETNNE